MPFSAVSLPAWGSEKSPHAAALNTACLDTVPQDLGDQACGPLLASQTALNLLDQVSGEPHVVPGLFEGLDGTLSLGVVVLEVLLDVVPPEWSGFALAPWIG